MRRREFITLLGGAAAAWPLAARAQQPAMPVIGFLNGNRPRRPPPGGGVPPRPERSRLRRGQNVAIEYRWAEGHRIGCRRSRLIWSPSGGRDRRNRATVRRVAAKATTTIPIVFTSGDDPVKAASSPASTGRAATSPA